MTTAVGKKRDAKMGMQAFLVLDSFVRLLIWSASLAVTITLMTRLKLWPADPLLTADFAAAWQWSQVLSTGVVIYNMAYVIILVLLKLPIPCPREGRYELAPGTIPSRQLVWSALIAVLTKARIEAPFPAFLVYHICNLPPMRWLVGPTLGPHSGSCNVTQPILADPHLTTFGKNVVIGYGASIAAHTQDRDGVTIARVSVEDDALIGAHALIYGGCTIKRGAMILGGAVLRPFTVVGEHEVWGGVPAKKLQVSAPANKQ